MVIRMSPIGPKHSDPVDVLTEIFVTKLAGHARVRIRQPFLVGDDSEPEPDIALVASGRYREAHPSQAFLLVEVADSSLAHDRVTKSALYAEASVPEYWIVNVQERSVEVYDSPRDGKYTRVRRFVPGDDVQVGAFADVVVRVGDLF